MVTHPARTWCVIYTTAIGRVRPRRLAAGRWRRPVVLRPYAGNLSTRDGQVQQDAKLVTEEQHGASGRPTPASAERRIRTPSARLHQRQQRTRATTGQCDRGEVRDHPVVGRVLGGGPVHGEVPVQG